MKALVPGVTNEGLREALARIAEGEIGVRETGGNNRGVRIREYQLATWLEPDAWPWCAAFVCWCVREWLAAEAVRRTMGLTQVTAERWRPMTAAAFGFEEWAHKHGMQVLPETAECRRGDLVTFDFSHIGIVTKGSKSGAFWTVEGNTEPKTGKRDGGGVYAMQRRPRSIVRRFIRVVD